MEKVITLLIGIFVVISFNSAQAQKLSKYGGYTELSGNKTGFFHVEQVDGRWWLIDPDGYVFISLGPNHVGPSTLLRDYNREKNIQKFGDPGNIQGRRIPSDSEFMNNFKKMVADDIKELNMNTYGAFSSLEYKPPKTAYYLDLLGALRMSTWMYPKQFPDVWSDEWAQKMEDYMVNTWKIKEVKDDPWLLGYWFICATGYTFYDVHEHLIQGWIDPNRFSFDDQLTWEQTLKTARGRTPAKKVYVELMRKRHLGHIGRFNRVYGTNIKDFDDIYDLGKELLSFEEVVEASVDDEEFFRLIYRQYLSTLVGLVKKYDTNHMIFGDRWNCNNGPRMSAVEESKNWVDATIIHTYGYYDGELHRGAIHKDVLEQLYRIMERPILLGDSCFSTPIPEMPDPWGPHVSSQAERGKACREYAEKVFSLPYIIGWNWCGYIDQYASDAEYSTPQHSGFKNVYGEFHTGLTDVMKEVNGGIYEFILNK